MLFGLRHGTFGGGDHQDGAIHLGRTGDHVLDVVAVTGHVHMGIVPLVGRVFHVGNVDGDAAFLLFRGIVDGVEGAEFGLALETAVFGDGCRQGGFAVVNVTHGAHVHVGLVAYICLFRHNCSP